MDHRSGCPINLAVEVLGDRWSVVVLRDMMFGNRRTFRDLHVNSLEGIATNILAARLKHLEAEGLITFAPDSGHKQKKIDSLSEKAISLVPVLVHLGAWGLEHTPSTPELGVRAEVLARGGPKMWEDFMAELRSIHLGISMPEGVTSVCDFIQKSYEAVLNEQQKS